MKYQPIGSPEILDPTYNNDYYPSIDDEYIYSYSQIPLVVKHPDNANLKIVQVTCTADIKSQDEIQILKLAIKLTFYFEPEEYEDDCKDLLEAFFIDCCYLFNEAYKIFSKDHAVKFKDLYRDYQNYRTEANVLLLWLYKKHFLK